MKAEAFVQLGKDPRYNSKAKVLNAARDPLEPEDQEENL